MQSKTPAAGEGARRESADSILAKNLVIARLTAGITQSDLAVAADISRATIAQLETGCSDPRLSTIVDLATALNISPILLLIGLTEARALVELPRELLRRPVEVPNHDIARMVRYVQSGMLKDRIRAGRIGASLADVDAGGHGPAPASIAASILSAILPGDGTAIGIALGALLASATRQPTTRSTQTPQLITEGRT